MRLLVLLLLQLALLLLLLLALILASLLADGLAQVGARRGRGVDHLHLSCRFGNPLRLRSAERSSLDNRLVLLVHGWQDAQLSQLERLTILRLNRLVRRLALSIQVGVPSYLHISGAFKAAATLKLEELARVLIRIVHLVQARL